MFARRNRLVVAAAWCLVALGVGSAAFIVSPQRVQAEEKKPMMEKKDIIDTATGPGMTQVTTVVTAIKAAGLVDTLKGAGPFTVFAPTDAAFAALPAGTLDGLLKDPAALKKVLLYHVVSSSVTADKVVGLTSATSVEGSPIAISVKDRAVYLNGSAKVVTPDVMASNGVIHVIDKVILPPAS